LARAKLSLALCLLWVIAVPAAHASQSATLNVALRPERPGGRTTLEFSLHITPHGERVPSPLVSVNLFYPKNIGLVTSGLGLETCTPIQLEVLRRCPPNSLMGYGKVLVEVPFGPKVLSEEGRITTWMAPVEEGHLALFFYAAAQTPVLSEAIFPAQVLEAPSPYGGQLAIRAPLIPTLPEAPDASVTDISSTIGPMNVTYYARSMGKRTPYHPNGIRLPKRCPRAGFPFAAAFSFADHSQTHVATRVPCPRTRNPS
jgi:hypothetical protein